MTHDPDDDRALLAHYVALGREPWNTSLESAWLEYELRRWALPILRERDPRDACNVGIGAGAWDDWLGHVLQRSITSVDRDPDCCRMLALRQRREAHPYRARVVCGDVREGVLGAARFDLITVVGSTLAETGERDACLAAIDSALRPGGAALLGEVGHAPAAAAEGEVQRLGELWLATRMVIK